MPKSIAAIIPSAIIPIAQWGIPFAAAAAPIREAHRAKKALPVRLPISGTLRNPQKERRLPRHELMHTDTRICASQSLPPVQKLRTFAAGSNIIQVNGPGNSGSSCLGTPPGPPYSAFSRRRALAA
jgi:hypothetical protein